MGIDGMGGADESVTVPQDAEVSIIMPAYNAQASLVEAVESVQAQTHRNWHLYHVNDASTDGTAALIQSLAAADDRIHPMRMLKRSGAAATRNAAIHAATGRYVAFLDADDLWAPQKLSRQLAFMKKHDAAFSFTGYWRGGKNRHWRYVPAVARVDHKCLLRANVIGCLTVMYDRTAFPPLDMPLLTQRQDYAFWLRLLEHTSFAYGLNEDLAAYRTGHSASLSGGHMSAQRANWHFFRKHRGLGIVGATSCMYSHLLHKMAWLLRARLEVDPEPWLVTDPR